MGTMTMQNRWCFGLACVAAAWGLSCGLSAVGKEPIKAIYIPLADHYAGLVAYEKYRGDMKEADYQLERMKSWDLLRAYFLSGEVDVAYIICPMAMEMFADRPSFRWVSLLHRDGNALAINELLNRDVHLSAERLQRKPDHKVADALAAAKLQSGKPVECGVPSLLSTHTVVLYKYLRDYGKTLALGIGTSADVLALAVPPPRAPSFIKKKNSRGIPACFEQSLPWADVVETQGFGKVAWYSKDVLPWPHGHVECIVIATDECVRSKRAALQEVIHFLHRAGRDIEIARRKGGEAMVSVSNMIRKHIPEHNEEAIVQSLRADLNVINYSHLNVDPSGLNHIMQLAVEGGILKRPINVAALADSSFATELTEEPVPEFSLSYTGFADTVSPRMRELVRQQIDSLSGWARDPVVVKAVSEQNAQGVALKRIKEIDAAWTAGGEMELAERLQANAVGTFLRRKLETNVELYTEAFLCDRNGAVVGEHPKTSDYWQGDEEKFTRCFNGGAGQPHTSPLVYDESTTSFGLQISLPVRSGDATIGVLVVGTRNLR